MFDLGIVGVGAWGKKLINAAQGNSAAVRFVSAATRTPSKVGEFAAERNIDLSDDYGSVLSNPSVQGCRDLLARLATCGADHGGHRCRQACPVH